MVGKSEPFLVAETRHVYVFEFRSPHVRAILEYLSRPTSEQIEGLKDELSRKIEDHMRRVSTILREFKEGLDAVKEANETKNARIEELTALVAELRARPTLSEKQREDMNTMVEELANLTGQPITDEDTDAPDEGSEVPPTDAPPADNPTDEPDPNADTLNPPNTPNVTTGPDNA